QCLIIDAAAPRRCNYPRRYAECDCEDHRAQRQLDGGRKQDGEFVKNWIPGDGRYAEIAVEKSPHVLRELLPDRLIEAHLMNELGVPFRGDAALPQAYFDG